MKVYLDNSVLNRPFDDQSISKIRLETIATFFIFELIEKRKIKLVNPVRKGGALDPALSKNKKAGLYSSPPQGAGLSNGVNSSVIEYENLKNPFFERKIWISVYLSKATFYQKINPKIKQRSKEIEKLKIPSIDSLHLASAEVARVDCFLTCDYDIIRKYRGNLKVVNPVDFIQLFKSK